MEERTNPLAFAGICAAVATLLVGSTAPLYGADWDPEGTNGWKGPFITGPLPAWSSVYVWNGSNKWNCVSNTADPVRPPGSGFPYWLPRPRTPVYVLNASNWAETPPIVSPRTMTPEQVRQSWQKMMNDAVRKAAPEKFASYEHAVAQGVEIETARAALAVLDKTAEGLGAHYSSNEQKEQVVGGYYNAWWLCLRLWERLTDPAAKHLIVERWETALTKAEPGLVYQLRALDWEGIRAFVTESLWALLRNSKDSKVLNAVSCIIYHHLELVDVKSLEEGLAPSLPPTAKGYLLFAIGYARYDRGDHRLPDGSLDPGPAQMPPHWED